MEFSLITFMFGLFVAVMVLKVTGWVIRFILRNGFRILSIYFFYRFVVALMTNQPFLG
ncbi:hypothetical protein J26TS2_44750 [Shouchella clausii]|nr:hypothetical protein J26TS2_44750 [Shouchella clausii]